MRAVAVEGTRYLDPQLVLERLAVDTMQSVWDDTEPLAARLKSLPQVSGVEITRKLPGTLVVTIQENLPVALAPSPRGLEAVDSLGVVLPIDPLTDDLDLPIAVQRDKSILSMLADARSNNPTLYRRISEVSRDGSNGLILRLALNGRRPISAPAVSTDSSGAAVASAPFEAPVLRVRAPLGVSATRLTDIFPVESDLLRRRAKVAELDLRYRDQVIARLQ